MIKTLISRSTARGALGAAVVALALLGGIGSIPPAAKADVLPQIPIPPPCTTYCYVELTFESVTHAGWSDEAGSGQLASKDTQLEVFGTLAGSTPIGTGRRMLGTWEQSPSGCPLAGVPWGADGPYAPCPRYMGRLPYEPVSQKTDLFADAPLCTTYLTNYCVTPYTKNNNKMRLMLAPGQQLTASIDLRDLDADGSNEQVCWGDLTFGPFTSSELYRLNTNGTLASLGPNLMCYVHVTLVRVW